MVHAGTARSLFAAYVLQGQKTRPFAGAKGDNGNGTGEKPVGFLAKYEKSETTNMGSPKKGKACLDTSARDILESSSDPVAAERQKGGGEKPRWFFATYEKMAAEEHCRPEQTPRRSGNDMPEQRGACSGLRACSGPCA